MLRSGVTLDDRYRLDERVATGGMGDVWRATDLTLRRTVAVKVLLPALSADPSFGARFRAESRMMAAVRHPGVVQVYDRGECALPDGERATYLVMEYVDGEPLSELFTRVGRVPADQTMSIVAQAARAFEAVHAGGIVHRDVKPSNLLIRPDGTVVLLDFGVARSAAVTSVTGTNSALGTVNYMAPEQATREPVSPATDVYALGAVAYHALAGDPPFTGDNPLAVAMRHVDSEPPELPADVPGPVRLLVFRALAKDPADRYPTAAALAEAAQAAAAGTVSTGEPATTAALPAVLAPGWNRRRVAAVTGAGAGAGALALAALLLVPGDGGTPPVDQTTPTPPAATAEATPPAPDRTAGPGRTASPGPATPTASPDEATPSEEPEESEPATPPNPTTAEPEPTGSPAAGPTPSAAPGTGAAR